MRPGRAMLLKMTIAENLALAPLTTLGIGGPARYYCRAADENEAAEALAWARARSLPVWVLGGGSNVVIADGGLPGLVLAPAMRGRQARALEANVVELEIGAGEPWDELAAWTVEQDLAGLECLSGIPGSVGATPVQNVGAYGQEVAETLASLRALDRLSGEALEFARADCGFSYRRSRFNGADAGRYLITTVRLRLRRHGAPTLRYAELRARLGMEAAAKTAIEAAAGPAGGASLAATRAAVLALRRGKGMVIEPSDAERHTAGSFFKNPVVTPAQYEAVAQRAGAPPPRFAVNAAEEAIAAAAAAAEPIADDAAIKIPAAWLIERAGFSKGYRRGRAGISSRHALALVNYGGASAAELLALAREITAGVRERFAIELRQEPVLLGFEES